MEEVRHYLSTFKDRKGDNSYKYIEKACRQEVDSKHSPCAQNKRKWVVSRTKGCGHTRVEIPRCQEQTTVLKKKKWKRKKMPLLNGDVFHL